jgi:subtilisin family serine protease
MECKEMEGGEKMRTLLRIVVFLLALAMQAATSQGFDALPNEAIVTLSETTYGRLLQTFGRVNVAHDIRLQQILPGVKSLRWICENLPVEGSEAREKLFSIRAERWAVVEFSEFSTTKGLRSAVREEERFATMKAILEESGIAETVSPNRLVRPAQYSPVPAVAVPFEPDDPVYPAQKPYLQHLEPQFLWKAPSPAIATNKEIAVVVMDSGVDAFHPDLAENIDFTYGKSFVGKNPYTDEGQGFMPHGTNISGIIAARGNNSLGIAGISWNTGVVPFQVFRKESNPNYPKPLEQPFLLWSSDEIIIRALMEVLNLPHRLVIVDISTLVWENQPLRLLLSVLKEKALIVASAGNNLQDTGSPDYDWLPCGASDLPNVVCVTALARWTGGLAAWCNYGKRVNLAAPGEELWTTEPGNDYRLVSGTSFAVPMVVGTIALAASTALTSGAPISAITPTNLKQALLAGAKFNPYILANYPLWQIEKPRQVWVPGMWRALQRVLAGQPAELPASPRIVVTGINNATTGSRDLAAGDWVSVWGENFTKTPYQANPPSETLGGVQVLLNGRPLPLGFVGPNQINTLLPDDPTWLWLPPTQNTLIVVRVNADGEAKVDSASVPFKFAMAAKAATN